MERPETKHQQTPRVFCVLEMIHQIYYVSYTEVNVHCRYYVMMLCSAAFYVLIF